MSLTALFVVVALFWLLAMTAGSLSIRWTFRAIPQRFVPAVICAILGFLIGYFGMTRFRVEVSQKVNGQVQWHFDSKWWFLVPMLFGLVALGYAIWKRSKMIRTA